VSDLLRVSNVRPSTTTKCPQPMGTGIGSPNTSQKHVHVRATTRQWHAYAQKHEWRLLECEASDQYGDVNMSNVYVEPRPKGRPEGSHIDNYVVEDRAGPRTPNVQNTGGGNRLGEEERSYTCSPS
jgi:hypothetical protein